MSLSQNGAGAINPAMMAKAESLYKELQRMATPTNIVQMPTQDGGEAGKFPVQLGTADPMDVQMSVRQQAIGPDGKVDGMGYAIADKTVFDYLERKKEDEFLAQFQAYVNAQATLDKPAEAAWWFERFPWLKEKRLAEIERMSELQKRLAQIQVTGIQNEDDMKILFAIDQGLIQVPTVPVNKLYDEKNGYLQPLTNFKAGLFSPLSRKPGGPGGYGLPNALTDTPVWSSPLDPNNRNKKAAMPGLPTTYLKGTGGAGGLFPGP